MITAVHALSIHYPGYIIILFLDAVFLSQNSIFMRQISRLVLGRVSVREYMVTDIIKVPF